MGSGNSKNGATPNYMGADGTFGVGPSTAQISSAQKAKQAWFDSPLDLTDEELRARGITGDAKNLTKFRLDRQIYQANKLIEEETKAQKKAGEDAIHKTLLGTEIAQQKKKQLEKGGRQATIIGDLPTTPATPTPKTTLLGL